MEPDHVKETPSRVFVFAADDGDICDGLRGLDDYRQELLAERGQAERANQSCWFAARFEFCVRLRPRSVTRAARDDPNVDGSAWRYQGGPKSTKVHVSAMELAIAVAHAGCGKTSTSATPSYWCAAKRKEHSHGLKSSRYHRRQSHDLTVDTLRGYFVRYRLALYLSSAAAVALGVVLNWNWLTAAGLLRVVAVLPCALMMFSCIRPGILNHSGKRDLSRSKPREMNHDDGRYDARNDVGHGICMVAGYHCLDPGSSSARQISALLMQGG